LPDPTVRRLLFLALLLATPCAWPHATQLSASRIDLHGRVAQARLELNARDVEIALHTTLTSPDGVVAAAALERAQPAIAGYVLRHARVIGAAGGACQGAMHSVQPKAEHVVVLLRWSCPPASGMLRYHVTLFQEIDASARHMVTVQGDVRRMGLLSAASQRLDLMESRASAWEVAWHYLLAGIEHIAAGYDHVAFLLAVILWARRLWPLVGVVTAFTVAHSITLTLAVLDVVVLPSRLVEVLIALSIVYVAAENFFVHDLRRRWRVTFFFGLVHGFGFAGVLRDYGLPRDALVPALAAFNVGVEAGQIGVVLLAACAMRVIKAVLPAKRFPERRTVFAVSSVIFALGVYWTSERTLG
jgi:hydrogenase/urease accessory protein HupE